MINIKKFWPGFLEQEQVGRMDPRRPRANAVVRPLAASLLLVGCALPVSAQPTDTIRLPPAATPGGAQPLPGRLPRPSPMPLESFEIPPLIERPLGLEQGPRIRVEDFRLDGATSLPDLGLSLAAVDAILERHLAMQPPDGYTVNQLQAVADDVTIYYRQQGLILAQVFVPAQAVRGGVVTLRVMEGTLGAVDVEGNELYSTTVVTRPFSGLVNRPVDERAIEAALLTLQNFPGLTVFGTFRQGAEVGETELLVRVREENRASITPMIDNYGSAYTGESRFAVQFEVNNPFGVAPDRISGYALKTFDPSNGTYGGIDYMVKMGARGRSALGAGISRNTFDVTDANLGVDLDLHGVVEQRNVYWERNYAQRRLFRAAGTWDIARKDAVTKQPGGDPADELTNLSYTFDYYTVGRRRRGINVGYFRFTAGENDTVVPSRTGGSGATASGWFNKFEFSYQRLQRFGQHHALLLRLNGQYSDDLLVSLEQYSIGGPANVRAYPVSEALIDTGGSVSLEWIIDAPGFAEKPIGSRTWGDVFQLSFFVDYAGGEVNDPFPLQSENVNLKGYGIGAQFSVSDLFYLRLDVAKPDGAEPSNGRDPQYYLSFNYTF